MEPQVFFLNRSPGGSLSNHDMDTLLDHLARGRFAVLPTETGPMLACDALNEKSISRLFSIKGRSAENPIHVALSRFSAAEDYVVVNGASERIAGALMPGPITIVLPKKPNISDKLVAGTGHLGIRIVDNPVTQLICEALRAPITATSLNPSGEQPADSVVATIKSLNWHEPSIVYVVGGHDTILYDKASTVIRFLEGQGEHYEVLREGPIVAQNIENAVRRLSFQDMADWG